MKFNLLLYLGISLLLFTACIEDTDFDQTDDIVVSPIVELDFLLYTIESDNFTILGEQNLIVSDTTNFLFLNDEFTIDNLIKAEFLFKHTNSFSEEFTTQYLFLSETNEPQYEITIPVASGSLNAPLVTEHVEVIEGESMTLLTNSDKVVVQIVASSPLDNIEGSLNLQSKTTYYLRVEQ